MCKFDGMMCVFTEMIEVISGSLQKPFSDIISN